jgi:hypothetical protein
VLTPLAGARLGPLAVAAKRPAARALSLVRASSQQLTIGDNAALSTGNIDFTFAGWVYVQTAPSGALFPAVATKYSSGTIREWALYHDGSTNRLSFVVYTAAGAAIATVSATTFGAVPTGTWMFVVAWHDAAADTINIQVNDGAVNSAATGAVGPADTTGIFRVGYLGTSTYYWDGRLDELAFWKRTLTAGEKTALYNGGAGLNYAGAVAAAMTTSLQAWWPLGEESGSRADVHGANTLAEVNAPGAADGVVVE